METVSTALRLHSQLITFGIKASRLGASDLNLFKLLKTLTAIEFSLRRVAVAQPTSGEWFLSSLLSLGEISCKEGFRVASTCGLLYFAWKTTMCL